MRLGLFLSELLPPSLQDVPRWLDGLDGMEIGLMQPVRTVAEAQKLLAPWMPFWFVPFAVIAPGTVAGLDLRPERLAAGQLRVLETDGVGELAVASLDMRSCLRRYLVAAVLARKAVNQGPRPELARALARVTALVGTDLVADIEGATLSGLERWLWDSGAHSPLLAELLATPLGEAPGMELYRIAIAESPDCLQLRYHMAITANALEVYETGMSELRAAMECPLYTRHRSTLDQIRRTLSYCAGYFPEQLPADSVRRWTEAIQGQRPAQIAEAVATGALSAALRLAVDDAYQHGMNRSRLQQIRDLGGPAALCAFRGSHA